MEPVLGPLILPQDSHRIVPFGYAQVERAVLTAAQALASCRSLSTESFESSLYKIAGDIRLVWGWGDAQSVYAPDTRALVVGANRNHTKMDKAERLSVVIDS